MKNRKATINWIPIVVIIVIIAAIVFGINWACDSCIIGAVSAGGGGGSSAASSSGGDSSGSGGIMGIGIGGILLIGVGIWFFKFRKKKLKTDKEPEKEPEVIKAPKKERAKKKGRRPATSRRSTAPRKSSKSLESLFRAKPEELTYLDQNPKPPRSLSTSEPPQRYRRSQPPYVSDEVWELTESIEDDIDRANRLYLDDKLDEAKKIHEKITKKEEELDKMDINDSNSLHITGVKMEIRSLEVLLEIISLEEYEKILLEMKENSEILDEATGIGFEIATDSPKKGGKVEEIDNETAGKIKIICEEMEKAQETAVDYRKDGKYKKERKCLKKYLENIKKLKKAYNSLGDDQRRSELARGIRKLVGSKGDMQEQANIAKFKIYALRLANAMRNKILKGHDNDDKQLQESGITEFRGCIEKMKEAGKKNKFKTEKGKEYIEIMVLKAEDDLSEAIQYLNENKKNEGDEKEKLIEQIKNLKPGDVIVTKSGTRRTVLKIDENDPNLLHVKTRLKNGKKKEKDEITTTKQWLIDGVNALEKVIEKKNSKYKPVNTPDKFHKVESYGNKLPGMISMQMINKDPDKIFNLSQNFKLTKSLLELAEKVLEKEDALIELRDKGKAVFIGDTHGDFQASKRVYEKYLKNPTNSYDYLVFMGDYIDRGKHSVENINFLLYLKCMYPKKVILLRGNHELRDGRYDCIPYDFLKDLKSRYGEEEGHSKMLENRYFKVFQQLPTMLTTEKGIIAVHGAIPSIDRKPKINKRADLRKITKKSARVITMLAGVQKASEADKGTYPAGKEDEGFETDKKGKKTGRTVGFTLGTLNAFFNATGLKMLLRGHEADNKDELYNDKVKTIFTSEYYERNYNMRREVALVNLVNKPEDVHILPLTKLKKKVKQDKTPENSPEETAKQKLLFEESAKKIAGDLYQPDHPQRYPKHWFYSKDTPKEQISTCWKFHIYMDPDTMTDYAYFKASRKILEYISNSDELHSKHAYDLENVKKLETTYIARGKEPIQKGKAIVIYLRQKYLDNSDYHKVRKLAIETAKDIDKILYNIFKTVKGAKISGDAKAPYEWNKSGLIFYRFEGNKPGPGTYEQCGGIRDNVKGGKHNVLGNPDIFTSDAEYNKMKFREEECTSREGKYSVWEGNNKEKEGGFWCPIGGHPSGVHDILRKKPK